MLVSWVKITKMSTIIKVETYFTPSYCLSFSVRLLSQHFHINGSAPIQVWNWQPAIQKAEAFICGLPATWRRIRFKTAPQVGLVNRELILYDKYCALHHRALFFTALWANKAQVRSGEEELKNMLGSLAWCLPLRLLVQTSTNQRATLNITTAGSLLCVLLLVLLVLLLPFHFWLSKTSVCPLIWLLRREQPIKLVFLRVLLQLCHFFPFQIQ